MKGILGIAILTIVLSLIVAACAPLVPATSTPVVTAAMSQREAQVQSVEIQVLQSDPPQVNAVVRGNLTESCAALGESRLQYAGNTFQITVYAISPTDRGCAQVTTPFETVIPLDTNGKPAGTYQATANGATAVFSLPIEKLVESTATPIPPATAVPTGAACTDSAAFVSDVTI